MGDIADMVLEDSETFEEDRYNFRHGIISESEAYELGIVDELGYEIPSGRKKELVCKFCNKKNLNWKKQNDKWRMFEGDKLHVCPVNPLVER